MRIKNLKNKKAFTLVEMLLYIAVLGICLTAMSAFIDMINAAKTKNRLVIAIERQGENISSLVQESIKNSNGINTPSSGSNNSLSLSFADNSKNPTIFSLLNGVIYIQEGASNALPLNDASIIAENLFFQNNSRSDAPNNINFSFDLRSQNQERAELSYKQSFFGGASGRF